MSREEKVKEKVKIIKRLRFSDLDLFHLEILIDSLPRQTYDCEPFGLMFMQTGGEKSKKWICCYYSHYSKKRDERIPIIKSNSMKGVALKMLRWFAVNMPNSLIK